ncbi:MAG: glycosyltransferase family protein [Rhodospirillales bacterium]|nr:glycosyltransferase family protein [Rhodospirillales bacterium]
MTAEADALLAEARGHHQAGRLLEAERLYKRLAAKRPADAMLLSRLGAALAGQGKLVEALAALRRALEIDADLVDALNNIGIVHRLQGRVEAAAEAFNRALAINPDLLSAHVNLGALLYDAGKPDEAEQVYRRALAIDPDLAEAHNGLGAVQLDRGALDEAAAAFERALALDPGHAVALSNLGSVKRQQGDHSGAADCYRRALVIRPRLVEAHANLGNMLRGEGAFDDAAAALRRALDIDRSHPEAHWNLAGLLLLKGNFKDGWAEYEWRAKCRQFRGLKWDFGKPRWNGTAIRRKHILLYAEQGLGDAIQFVRYVPLVAEQARHVVVRCPPPLARLFETVAGVAVVGPDIETKTRFHVAAPLMSLPAILGTDLATIPSTVPYLAAPSGVAAPLATTAAPAGTLKVGLAWAGNPEHKNDRNRSIGLARLAPLLDTPGCTFYSLQVGAGRDAIGRLCLGDRITDLGQGFGDFADTAATIAALDLVIAVDTSVAHLAGALAKPVWTLLPRVPDWRWLMDRDDSPWYPTMRLFRQRTAGDWSAVVAAVAAALRDRAAQGAPAAGS